MINKISIKNFNFRTKVYAGIAAFIIIAIFVRVVLVQIDRGRPIVSFTSEWNRYGKPVVAKTIQAVDMPIYAQFTVMINSEGLASGFVTADIRNKLKESQDVCFAEDDVTCGKILKLGTEMDIYTGMFPVEIGFDTPIAKPGSIQIVFAHTETLPRVLVVPNNIIDISRDNYYLWKVTNGKAQKVRVGIGLRNGYGTVIEDGIRAGDQIVFVGQSALKENDKVNILDKDKAK
jgi:hypothetical protein